MTATIQEPATCTSTTLAYKSLLEQHRDTMVQRLVDHHHVPQPLAAAMIDQLWDRWIARLVEDYAHKGVDQPLAERIMNEALGFLALCAIESGHGPSPMVDLGWHTAILYTGEYEVLCFALAGRFLHHEPTDVAGFTAKEKDKCKPCNCSSRCEHQQIGTLQVRADCGSCGNEVKCDGSQGNCHQFRATAPSTQTTGSATYADGACQCRDGQCDSNGDGNRGSRTIADTVAAMQMLGPVDTELWTGRKKCQECTSSCSTQCEH